MYTYTINNISDIRTLLCAGIAPGKTLRFDFYGEPVTVTLALDSEMEDVYVAKYGCTRRKFYDFDKLVSNLENLYTNLYEFMAS